ncbi:MAG: PD40 domain-containing protein [Chitinophagaceae bacterium]|nr:PD40 domain-containing protein [Chitinophagaceae bacterium]
MVQIYGISPNGGPITQISFNQFPVVGPLNISPDDKYIAYIADHSVFITDIQTHKSERLTPRDDTKTSPFGAAIWSNDGKSIAFNRKTEQEGKQNIQIFLLTKNE